METPYNTHPNMQNFETFLHLNRVYELLKKKNF